MIAQSRRDRVPPGMTRVLLALLAVYERDGRATMRAVAKAAGRNLTTTTSHLQALRRRGLVNWEDGQQATLRPTVGKVR